MTDFTPFGATLGGILIGLSALLLMGVFGRIAGISGICGGIFSAERSDRDWRVMFVAGLILVPFAAGFLVPELLRSEFSIPLPYIALAGVMVGLGTTLGHGCTSGHGVCGNARLSIRSIIATLTFMVTGVATTFIVRHILGGLA